MIWLNNIKTILIVAGIVAAVWFFKDYKHQKAENKRQTENNRMLRYQDSLKYAQQLVNQRELNEYLEHENKELATNLRNTNIRFNRIEKIINQRLIYRDKEVNTIEAKGLVLAVKEDRPYKVPVVDSTQCLVIRGVLQFDGQEIELEINDREFTNVTDVVTYWERRKWKIPILGINTRIFGKKQVTVKVFNSCGETETYVVEKK